MAYVKSGCTAAARFPGIVHGVVVQTSRYSLSLPSIANLTKIDGSVSSQYSISASASAVSHLGHHGSTLRSVTSRSLSYACLRVHQTDAMYDGLIVRYGLSQSIQTPRSLKSSVILVLNLSAKSLHVETNLSMPWLLDLLLALDPEGLLDLDLDRQSVHVVPGLVVDSEPLHAPRCV